MPILGNMEIDISEQMTHWQEQQSVDDGSRMKGQVMRWKPQLF